MPRGEVSSDVTKPGNSCGEEKKNIVWSWHKPVVHRRLVSGRRAIDFRMPDQLDGTQSAASHASFLGLALTPQSFRTLNARAWTGAMLHFKGRYLTGEPSLATCTRECFPLASVSSPS